MSEWNTFRVGDLEESNVLLVQDGNHGEYRPRPNEFAADGIAYIRAADMSGGLLSFGRAEHINSVARARIRKGIGAPLDVILSHKGTVGKVAFAPKESAPFVCSPQTTFWRSLDHHKIDPRFLFHFLQSPRFTAQLRALENETDMAAYVSLTQQRGMFLTLPTIDKQRAIGDVLGALDDKIAVNARIAATAQELAIALASGRTWAKRVKLGEVCELRKKMVSPGEMHWPVVAHYSLPAYDQSRMPELVEPATIRSGKFLVEERAVLLSKLNPEIPRIWNIEPDNDIPALASTEFLVLVPQSGVSPQELWAVTARAEFISELASKATGTSNSHQRVQPSEVLATDIVDPRQFGPVADEIRGVLFRESVARNESLALAALRDTLLPKLMSGQITVREAESAVEDAT